MSSDDKRQLGKILLKRKLVPRELEGALRERPQAAAPAAPAPPQAVVEEKDAEVLALLALAERSGVPGLDLRLVTIALDHLDAVPREVAEALGVLPVLLRDDRIYLAMANPQDKRAVDEIEFVNAKNVHPFVVVRATLLATIAAAYDAKSRGLSEYRGSRVPAVA
ncbi:MAG TPA: hypothetical protein VIF09_19140 [Polyangiaceae bacterium]|jgi:hypothetical protein